MASNSNEDLTFEELFNTPWFFGEMTEENAKAILMEASENDGKTVKRMIFMKAIGQNSLALFFGSISFFKGKADFSFGENHLNFWHIGAPEAESMVIRTKPFPLKELSMAKLLDRIDLVNLETLVIPKTIKKNIEKYLIYRPRFISLYGPQKTSTCRITWTVDLRRHKSSSTTNLYTLKH